MPDAKPANPLPEVRDADPPPAVPAEQTDESLVALLDRVADPDGDSRWDRSTKRTVLVILLVALVFIIYISRPVIPMILIAAILAYLLNPIVNAAERVRIPRAVTTIAIYLLVIGLFRLAVIIAQIFIRYQRGQTQDPRFAALESMIPLVAQRAREVAGE